MQKINRKIQLTKRSLRDALVELLNERHISQISISLLCQRANVNRSTFYKHYASVLALLDEIEEENLRYFETAINKLNKSSNTIDGHLILESLFRYIKINKEFFKSVLNNKNYGNFLDKLINEIYYKVDDKFPISLKKTPEIFVYVIHGSIALIKLWIDKDFHKTPKEMGHLILSFANTLIK